MAVRKDLMKILVTGGAGFIGSAVVRQMLATSEVQVANVDKLTYAGNLAALKSVENDVNYKFYNTDILDRSALREIFEEFSPDKVMHLAAESHVDRSIDGPKAFIETNIVGTFNLLEVSRSYYDRLGAEGRSVFLFHHVSTDEVYGDLGPVDPAFTEANSYRPSSPYSASKASSDHLVRSWHRTFGLPIVITNCSNNYGPYQYPEKLIPLVIRNALLGQPLPIFGKGDQIRDWLFVEDHADALMKVVKDGGVGETYNIGGMNEVTNLEVVSKICRILDDYIPEGPPGKERFESLIQFVEDRPGHDSRYAIDASKIRTSLGWAPKEDFTTGLKKTISWYIEHRDWLEKEHLKRVEDKGRFGGAN